MTKPLRPKQLVLGALIAAAYVALSFISNALGLAFGTVQIRLSEILCVLPLYTPTSIWGLTVGCVIANLVSPLGIIDIICGSAATLSAAALTYLCRNVKPRALALTFPVLTNAVIVGIELTALLGEFAFLINAVSVALGQIIAVYLLGYPLRRYLDKNDIFKRLS